MTADPHRIWISRGVVAALAAGALALGATNATAAPPPPLPPIPATSTPVLHPGGAVRSSTNALPLPFRSTCTLNFLFHDDDGHHYMGTAGHCAADPTTDGGPEDRDYDLWWKQPKERPVAFDGHDRRIGEFVYLVSQNSLSQAAPQDHTLPPAVDFGLVRLDPKVAASPSMCHFGGPTGLNATITSDPALIHYYGQGVGASSVHDPYTPVGLAARTAVAPSGFAHDSYFTATLFGLFSGDSGAPVVDTKGHALGILTGLPTPVDGTAAGMEDPIPGITRLQAVLDLLVDRIGLQLHLETAPFDASALAAGPHDPDCT